VRLNGGRVTPQTRLAAGDRVRIPPVRIVAEPQTPGPSASVIETVRQAIIYEDARLLVLDKPAGLAVHGGSGVQFGVIEALRALRPAETLELVHRLDRDTSGCLLVARTPAALRDAHAVLREGRSEKRYLALLAGRWTLGQKRIDVPLRTDTRVSGERTVRVDAGGKPSASDFPAFAGVRYALARRAHRESARGDAAYGPDSSDPRARRLCRPSCGGGREVR